MLQLSLIQWVVLLETSGKQNLMSLLHFPPWVGTASAEYSVLLVSLSVPFLSVTPQLSLFLVSPLPPPVHVSLSVPFLFLPLQLLLVSISPPPPLLVWLSPPFRP